jgi:hypothetical protein
MDRSVIIIGAGVAGLLETQGLYDRRLSALADRFKSGKQLLPSLGRSGCGARTDFCRS